MASGKDIVKGATTRVRLRINKTYSEYIKCLLERYSYAKSFFIRTEAAYLYDFYVPLSVRLGKRAIDKPNAESLAKIAPLLLVTGTAGSGKTMFMRHLLLSCLLSRAKVPIFVELRQLNQSGGSLRELMVQNLRECRFGLHDDYVDAALKAGHFAVLLDGLDEVAGRRKQRVVREIRAFAKIYDGNWCILSSRPDPDLNGWPQFKVATLEPLALDRACELVGKLSFDEEMKRQFLTELRRGLFEAHNSFLSNPLLLSIMLLTFGQSAQIPDKLNIFYGHAYEALFDSCTVQCHFRCLTLSGANSLCRL